MKHIITTGFLILSFCIALAQQDPQFSQNMFNHVAVNPGFSGIEKGVTTTAFHREQWVGFSGQPTTTLVSVNASVNPFGFSSGVSLTAVSDNIGYYSDFQAKLGYAYHIPLAGGELGFGFDLGLVNKALDASNFNPLDGGDLVIPQGNESSSAFDMGLGVFFKTPAAYIGIATTHLNQADLQLSSSEVPKLKRHYYFSAGYSFALPISLLDFQPSTFVKFDGAATAVSFNANFMYNKKFWGGVSYRLNDAIIPMFGIEFFNGFRIGYSYDISTSDLSNYHKNSHEIMLRYNFRKIPESIPQKYKSVRFL